MSKHTRPAMALLLLLMASCLMSAYSLQVQSLSGNSWKLRNSNGTISLNNVAVPGYVLSELKSARIVPDELVAYGERELRWVALDTWKYTITFTPSSALQSSRAIFLTLDRIDTMATVVLNGKSVGRLSSFHRVHRLDVKSGLKSGANSLSITIASAITAAETRSSKSSIPYLQNPGMLKGYNHLRKPAADFGWDWGPAFAPQGIAGGVQVIGFDTPVLVDALIRQDHTPSSITMIVVARFASALSLLDYTGKLSVSIPELGSSAFVTKGIIIRASPSLQTATITLSVKKADIQLWWPKQLGNQKLYNVVVRFQPGGGGRHDSSVKKRIGFRDAKLVTRSLDGDDNNGQTFYFTINGVALYMKGANLIPLRVIETDVSNQQIDKLLLAAMEGNHNMVRVWGGGRYQRSYLYEKADEMGLLVWQEFMFACSPYPADGSFLTNVKLEVQDQVFRLGSHPSIILWGGNNEVETSFDWYQDSRDNRKQYEADYVKLFIDVIGKQLQALYPEMPYWDSSPSNGYKDAAKLEKRWGYAGDEKWGDMHVYMYDKDCEDPSIYPAGRFVSEYGWQSYPSWHTYRSAMLPSELSPWSSLSEFRMRTPDGNAKIKFQMEKHHNLLDAWVENSTTSDTQAFKAWTYLSQVQQAKCYATALSTWREYQSTSCNMGTLYWQLNDIWQGPSWSSLDYQVSRWRMLHYVAKRVYAPLALHVRTNATHVLLYAHNDLTRSIQVNLRSEVLFWDDNQQSQYCQEAFVLSAAVPPTSSVLLMTDPLGEDSETNSMRDVEGDVKRSFIKYSLEYRGQDARQPPDLKRAPTEPACFRNLEVKTSQNRIAGVNARVTTYYFPSQIKDVRLSNPAIRASDFVQVDDNTVSFTVQSEKPAAWVAMETNLLGWFNDNAFFLHPCYPRYITFYSVDKPVLASMVEKSLRFTSLYDVQF